MYIIKEPEQQPEQGQMTAAEALELCANAVVLLLWGAVQTFMAATAVGATRRVTVSAVLGKLLSLSNAWILAAVLTGVVDIAAGRRLGDGFYYHALFVGFIIPLVFR